MKKFSLLSSAVFIFQGIGICLFSLTQYIWIGNTSFNNGQIVASLMSIILGFIVLTGINDFYK